MRLVGGVGAWGKSIEALFTTGAPVLRTTFPPVLNQEGEKVSKRQGINSKRGEGIKMVELRTLVNEKVPKMKIKDSHLLHEHNSKYQTKCIYNSRFSQNEWWVHQIVLKLFTLNQNNWSYKNQEYMLDKKSN